MQVGAAPLCPYPKRLHAWYHETLLSLRAHARSIFNCCLQRSCVLARARFREAIVRTTPVLMLQHNVPHVDVAFALGEQDELVCESFTLTNMGVERYWGEPRAQQAYRSGSISKPVVALAVLALARDGKIDLDEPLAPWLAQAFGDRADAAMHAWFARVTLRHLLSHSSGLASMNPPRDEPAACAFGAVPAWLKSEHVQLETPLAVRSHYSGVGYALIELVIESVMQMSMHDVVRQALFAPLRINAAFEKELWRCEGTSGAESSHMPSFVMRDHDEQGKAVRILPSACSASSGIVISPQELCVLVRRALWSDFLPPSLRASALQLQPADTQGAHFTCGLRGHDHFAKNGSIASVDALSLMHAGLRPGHASVMVIVPSRKAVACIATSARGGSKICKPLTGLFREINVAADA